MRGEDAGDAGDEDDAKPRQPTETTPEALLLDEAFAVNEDENADAIARCMQVAAAHYGVTVGELLDSGRGSTQKGRAGAAVRARGAAMWLARELTHASLPEIGRAFGRHHTTVMTVVRKVADRIRDHAEARASIAALEARVRNEATPAAPGASTPMCRGGRAVSRACFNGACRPCADYDWRAEADRARMLLALSLPHVAASARRSMGAEVRQTYAGLQADIEAHVAGKGTK